MRAATRQTRRCTSLLGVPAPHACWNKHISVTMATGALSPPMQEHNFLETLTTKTGEQLTRALDFSLKGREWEGIGNTPLKKLEDRLWAKLEGHNPSGSVKDRTVASMLLNMLTQTEDDGGARAESAVEKPPTLLLVSSGSAALALIKLRQLLSSVTDLNIVVAMPRTYGEWPIPTEIAEMPCTNTFHNGQDLVGAIEDPSVESGCSLALLDGPFIDTLAEAREIAEAQNWQLVDQHFDETAMLGHASTAAELLEDCPGLTDVVCGTGTGATAAGLRRFLPNHVKVHARQAESGKISGLCDVDRYDNFCDVTKLSGYTSNEAFDSVVAEEHTQILKDQYGIESGPSSGASFWLAKQVVASNPDAHVAFISADGSVA